MNTYKACTVSSMTVRGTKIRSLTSVITVHAPTLEVAVNTIVEELTKNPSRMAVYNKWIADGCFVERVLE